MTSVKRILSLGNVIDILRNRRRVICEQKETLLTYAAMKFESKVDWHGVADAAMDIREMDAQIKLIDDFLTLIEPEAD